MESLTEFGKTVVGVDPIKAKLDQTVKKVLAFKPLLARIFKEVVEECHDLSFEEIEACIEGDVLISKVPVDTGLPVTQDFKEAMDMCTYADYIEKKGIEQGIEQGIERGMMQGIVSLVNDGDITLKRAAEKLQMSIPTFKKKVKEYGFTLMI